MDPRAVAPVIGIALLATGNVGLWTLRVALAASGRRLGAAAVATAEAVLFALVFSTVLSSLDAPVRVIAYGVGVGAGTLLGMVVDARLHRGQSQVTAVLDGDGAAARHALHDLGWPVTTAAATGVRGEVVILSVAVDDCLVDQFEADLRAIDVDAELAVERLHHLRPARLPAEMRHAGK